MSLVLGCFSIPSAYNILARPLDPRSSRVELELTLGEGVGKLASLGAKKAQRAAESQHVYQGGFTYAQLGTNAVEYRVALASQRAKPQPGPLTVHLVIWCFAGFGPFVEVDDRLQTSGQLPPHYATTLSPRLADLKVLPAWELFKRALLDLPTALPDALRRHDAVYPLSSTYARVQTAFDLTALSLVRASQHLAKGNKATELVAELLRIMNLVWMRLGHGTAQAPIAEACLVVEKAALWYLRHGDKITLIRKVSTRVPVPLWMVTLLLCKARESNLALPLAPQALHQTSSLLSTFSSHSS